MRATGHRPRATSACADVGPPCPLLQKPAAAKKAKKPAVKKTIAKKPAAAKKKTPAKKPAAAKKSPAKKKPAAAKKKSPAKKPAAKKTIKKKSAKKK